MNVSFRLLFFLSHPCVKLMCMLAAFIRVGGFRNLHERYMTAIPNTTLSSNSTCGYPREDSWIMLRDPLHSDMPWPGFLLGQTPASIWYWCADQVLPPCLLHSVTKLTEQALQLLGMFF